MKMKSILIACCIMLLGNLSCLAQKHKYKLVWKEDFKGKTFDQKSWSKIPRGTANWNRHMSDDDRLYDVKDGRLILRGLINDGTFRYDSLRRNGERDTARYVTGGLFTKSKKTIGYGKVEIKAKLGEGQGAWPAIWMLPNSEDWPKGGEIDIMEHLNHDPFVYQTVHTYYTYVLKLDSNPPHYGTAPIKRHDFNVYAVEILPDSLVFSVNGKRTFSYPRIETDKEGQYPFTTEYYLLIDMQLGGDWVGKIDPSNLPVDMEIDWVKMYRLKE